MFKKLVCPVTIAVLDVPDLVFDVKSCQVSLHIGREREFQGCRTPTASVLVCAVSFCTRARWSNVRSK